MQKHTILSMEDNVNLRKRKHDITDEDEEIINDTLSNVSYPTNIPYFPAMYSNILIGSESSQGIPNDNSSASSMVDHNSDDDDDSTIDELSSIRQDETQGVVTVKDNKIVIRLKSKDKDDGTDNLLPFPELVSAYS